MSTIEEIIKIERETAEKLNSAKKEAEKIKEDARAEAANIIAQAKADRKKQSADIIKNIDSKIAEIEKKKFDEVNQSILSANSSFNQKADSIADWIVEQIIG